MEEFQNSAKKNNVCSTLVVGGTFGIFLTFGQAWSDFLQESIVALIPDHESQVVRALIYALSASFLCIVLLFALLRFESYMNTVRITNLTSKETRAKLESVVKIAKKKRRSRKDL